MDLKSILYRIDPNVAIFLLTSLIAFMSWILKGLIEKPLIESKKTFNRFLEKRVELLTEVKTRLNFIAYFPGEEESKVYKTQLQEILLKDGKAAYLNKETFDSVLRIAIDPKTDEKLLLGTITKIDEDLYKQISKVQDEIQFYKRFSNYNPLKRFIGYALLLILYVLSLSLVVSFLFIIIYCIIFKAVIIKIALIFVLIMGLYLINKWIKK